MAGRPAVSPMAPLNPLPFDHVRHLRCIRDACRAGQLEEALNPVTKEASYLLHLQAASSISSFSAQIHAGKWKLKSTSHNNSSAVGAVRENKSELGLKAEVGSQKKRKQRWTTGHMHAWSTSLLPIPNGHLLTYTCHQLLTNFLFHP